MLRVSVALIVLAAVWAPAAGRAADATGLQMWQRGERTLAIAHWRERAGQGDAEAGLYLGYVYRNGIGVARDEHAAAHWYTQAAQQGLPEAQYELGLMYELGLGVAQDPGEAARWYGLASGQVCPDQLSAGGRLGDR